MANKWKIALLAAGGLFALLILTAVAPVLFVNVNAYKPRLEAAASDALGMEVRIGGNLAVLNLKIHIEGKDRVLDLDPVTMRLFGGEGSGSLDFVNERFNDVTVASVAPPK